MTARRRPPVPEPEPLPYVVEVQGREIRHANLSLQMYLDGREGAGCNWRPLRYDEAEAMVVLVGLVHPAGLREQYGFFPIAPVGNSAATFQLKAGA
jgi:hypothetical protein